MYEYQMKERIKHMIHFQPSFSSCLYNNFQYYDFNNVLLHLIINLMLLYTYSFIKSNHIKKLFKTPLLLMCIYLFLNNEEDEKQ